MGVNHDELTPNHVPHAFTYATAAARVAAVGMVAADVGKLAKQSDGRRPLWRLTATTPTWDAVVPTGKNVIFVDAAGEGDYAQVGSPRLGAVEIASQLAGGHTVKNRDRQQSNERGKTGVAHIAFHFFAAQGVGPVENNERFARVRAGFHGQRHGPNEGVVTNADVLQVKNERIKVFQHGRGGGKIFSVKAEDGKACFALANALDRGLILPIRRKAVFRSEQGG